MARLMRFCTSEQGAIAPVTSHIALEWTPWVGVMFFVVSSAVGLQSDWDDVWTTERVRGAMGPGTLNSQEDWVLLASCIIWLRWCTQVRMGACDKGVSMEKFA